MKEIHIAEADITAVAKKLEQIAPFCRPIDPDLRSPAIKVIDCVLSLRTSYDRVVVPRLKNFRVKHPDTQQVTDLANLMASYPTPYKFIQQELNYNSERKAKMLQQVVKYLCQIAQKTPSIPEEENLKEWAMQANPQECYTLNIKYFAMAGFQYLRILFGADTTKPDVHIIRFVYKTLNRNVSDIESLLLLEAASKRLGLSVRAVDSYIWKEGARPAEMTNKTDLNDELRTEYDETLLKNGVRGKYAEQAAAGTNLVRLDPDVAAAFPTEEAVNEALRSILKERNKEK